MVVKRQKTLNTSKTLIKMAMLHQIFLNYLRSCFIQSISWTWDSVTKMLVDKMLTMTLWLISFTFLWCTMFLFLLFLFPFLSFFFNHQPCFLFCEISQTVAGSVEWDTSKQNAACRKKDWRTLPEHIVRVFWGNIWTHKIVFFLN